MYTKKIDAIVYKNNTSKPCKEEVVMDETVTLTINNNITRNLSAIKDSLKEFAVGYLVNENLVKSIDDIKKIEINNTNIDVEIDNELLKDYESVLCSDSAGGWRSKIENIEVVESDF